MQTLQPVVRFIFALWAEVSTLSPFLVKFNIVSIRLSNTFLYLCARKKYITSVFYNGRKKSNKENRTRRASYYRVEEVFWQSEENKCQEDEGVARISLM